MSDAAASDPQLKRWYARLNRCWFNGELPEDTVVFWEPAHGSLGECVADIGGSCLKPEDADDIVIRVDPCMRFSTRLAAFTLLHEMVHAKLLPYRGHGKRFQSEMLRLAQVGAFRNLW